MTITLVASLFEKRAAGLYHNTAAVLDAERGYLGKYRKMHIPDDPRYYEKYYFTPGDLGFKVFAHRSRRSSACSSAGTSGIRRPRGSRRMQGAEMLVYPTAIGWHPEEKAQFGERQHGAWETVQRGHAIANGCFVVAVNRTGFEPDPRGTRRHRVLGPELHRGAPTAASSCARPSIARRCIVEEIDLAEIDAVRAGWPFFRDRRIDAYGDITQRFGND